MRVCPCLTGFFLKSNPSVVPIEASGMRCGIPQLFIAEHLGGHYSSGNRAVYVERGARHIDQRLNRNKQRGNRYGKAHGRQNNQCRVGGATADAGDAEGANGDDDEQLHNKGDINLNTHRRATIAASIAG